MTMKGANFLEKLLDGQKVEWKKLGEVAENLDNLRRPVTGNNRVAGEYPYYGASGIVDYVDNYIFDGDYLLISEDGANLTARKTPIAFSISGKNWVNNHAHVLKFETYVERKFVEYYLNNLDISEYVSGAAQPKLNQANLNRIPIPLPSLSVQSRIVEILDKFTSLEAELEAELDCRKRQYIYYRELLLDFSEENKGYKVEWKKLGEIGTFTRGTSFQKKHFSDEGFPCIHYGQIYTRYHLSTDKTISYLPPDFAARARKAQTGDLVIATTSENDEDVCKSIVWEGQEEVVVSNDACFYHHSMNPRYVAYFFQTDYFQRQKRNYITGTKVRRVNANDLARIEIPLPPLLEQARIVEILDKFDTLTNSITEGLPLEIKLRKQQYEYYREQLLDFRR